MVIDADPRFPRRLIRAQPRASAAPLLGAAAWIRGLCAGLATLAALAALGACAPEPPREGDTAAAVPAEPARGGDTLRFTMRELRVEEGCAPGADSGGAGRAPCVTVELAYPDSLRAPAAALADSVGAFVRRKAFTPPADSAPAPSAEAAAEAFVGAYREAYRELPGEWQVWFLERQVEVACNTPRLVGLRAVEAQHTGGAHPNAWTELANFDPRTGRRLGVAQLFVAESLPALTAAAERAFREARQLPPDQPLADAGFMDFPDGRFALPTNVLVCPDSVRFHFDAYEVGPYALGPTSFALPTSAVRAWLRLAP